MQKKRQYFINLIWVVLSIISCSGKQYLLYLLEKKSKNSKITLVARNEVLIDDAKIAQTFNIILVILSGT